MPRITSETSLVVRSMRESLTGRFGKSSAAGTNVQLIESLGIAEFRGYMHRCVAGKHPGGPSKSHDVDLSLLLYVCNGKNNQK